MRFYFCRKLGEMVGGKKKKLKSYTKSLGSATKRYKHTKNTFIPHVILNYSWVVNMLTQPVNSPHFGIIYIMYYTKKKKKKKMGDGSIYNKKFHKPYLVHKVFLYHHHIMIVLFFFLFL